MLLAGGVLLVGVVVLGRRGDDSHAFACAIVATLALSPVLWLHYLVLLSVPLAICRPRFSAIWLVPIVLWVCPRADNGDGLQPFLPAPRRAAASSLRCWIAWSERREHGGGALA